MKKPPSPRRPSGHAQEILDDALEEGSPARTPPRARRRRAPRGRTSRASTASASSCADGSAATRGSWARRRPSPRLATSAWAGAACARRRPSQRASRRRRSGDCLAGASTALRRRLPRARLRTAAVCDCVRPRTRISTRPPSRRRAECFDHGKWCEPRLARRRARRARRWSAARTLATALLIQGDCYCAPSFVAGHLRALDLEARSPASARRP